MPIFPLPKINIKDVPEAVAMDELSKLLGTQDGEARSFPRNVLAAYISSILTEYAVRVDAPQSFNPTQQSQGRSNLGIPNSNYGGNRAPNANDDSADTSGVGIVFSRGSLWIDLSASPIEAYRCLDATPTQAEWEITTMDAAEVQDLIDAAIIAALAPFSKGAINGNPMTLFYSDGAVQYGFMDANATLDISGGAAGAELTFYIQYTTGAHDLNFSGVSMDAALSALLPITLEAEKAYVIKFAYFGGSWVLIDISGGFPQTLYP